MARRLLGGCLARRLLWPLARRSLANGVPIVWHGVCWVGVTVTVNKVHIGLLLYPG